VIYPRTQQANLPAYLHINPFIVFACTDEGVEPVRTFFGQGEGVNFTPFCA